MYQDKYQQKRASLPSHVKCCTLFEMSVRLQSNYFALSNKNPFLVLFEVNKHSFKSYTERNDKNLIFRIILPTTMIEIIFQCQSSYLEDLKYSLCNLKVLGSNQKLLEFCTTLTRDINHSIVLYQSSSILNYIHFYNQT